MDSSTVWSIDLFFFRAVQEAFVSFNATNVNKATQTIKTPFILDVTKLFCWRMVKETDLKYETYISQTNQILYWTHLY